MSPAGISAEQVRAFLDAYASAFQALDRMRWPIAVIGRILEMYRAMGVRDAAENERPKFLEVMCARGQSSASRSCPR